MAGFEHTEHLSRQEAAERLVDIAYALTGGSALELRHHVAVPVADEVILLRRTASTGAETVVDVLLSWSVPDHTARVTTRHADPSQA